MKLFRRPKAELSTCARVLYMALRGYADADGMAFPSTKRLARNAACSTRQVFRVLHDLEDRGLVVRVPAESRDGRRVHYEVCGIGNYVLSEESEHEAGDMSSWTTRIEMKLFDRPKVELSQYARMVYAALCGYVDANGIAFPSIKTIARDVACSERQVFRVLHDLEDRGLVVRRQQKLWNGGQGVNMYEVYGMDKYIYPSGASEYVENDEAEIETPDTERGGEFVECDSTPAETIHTPSVSAGSEFSTTEAGLSTGLSTAKKLSTTRPDLSTNRSELSTNMESRDSGDRRAFGGRSSRVSDVQSGGEDLVSRVSDTQSGGSDLVSLHTYITAPSYHLPYREHASRAATPPTGQASGVVLPEQCHRVPLPTVAPKKTLTQPRGEGKAAEIPAGVPQMMRPIAEYFMLKTGRTEFTALDVDAIRAVEKIHTPARVSAEIVKAVERFERMGRPLSALTMAYIYESLRRQKSLKPLSSRKGGMSRKRTRYEEEQAKRDRERWEKIAAPYEAVIKRFEAQLDAELAAQKLRESSAGQKAA